MSSDETFELADTTTVLRNAFVEDFGHLIREVPDFPEPGILFRDIAPLLADAVGLAAAVHHLTDSIEEPIDLVAGIESRGFLLAGPVAMSTGAGLVLIRKAGKLPGPCESQSYELEYGTATLEVEADTITPGAKVLLIDDVLATGGTAEAAAALIERCGGEVVRVSFLIELAALAGRSRLAGRVVDSVLVYS